MSSSKSVDNLSIYEKISHHDKLRRESDIVYRVLVNKDTKELDGFLKKVRSDIIKEFPDLSENFKVYTQKVIKSNKDYMRAAKHGLFFFFLFLKPKVAEKLIQSPSPKTDPQRFKEFYENQLQQCCNDLLQSKIHSFQAFVWKVRADYFVL